MPQLRTLLGETEAKQGQAVSLRYLLGRIGGGA